MLTTAMAGPGTHKALMSRFDLGSDSTMGREGVPQSCQRRPRSSVLRAETPSCFCPQPRDYRRPGGDPAPSPPPSSPWRLSAGKIPFQPFRNFSAFHHSLQGEAEAWRGRVGRRLLRVSSPASIVRSRPFSRTFSSAGPKLSGPAILTWFSPSSPASPR